jgi:hypothetical protein
MTNKSGQMKRHSRLAVVISLGLAVAAAACGEGANPTSPSGVSPSSLAANSGQSTRNFSVTMTPASVSKGAATLHVTVTRDETSGQNQQLGSVEIYVPSALTIQSVNNISNSNWTSGVTGQTVRVGAVGGNHKLDRTTSSVTFDINVASTQCGRYPFTTAQAANATYYDPFISNWIYTGGALSVEVTGCDPVTGEDCKAAPAVANEYLRSIDVRGQDREKIMDDVAQHMTQGAYFDGINPCDVTKYRAAVIAFVDALLTN